MFPKQTTLKCPIEMALHCNPSVEPTTGAMAKTAEATPSVMYHSFRPNLGPNTRSGVRLRKKDDLGNTHKRVLAKKHLPERGIEMTIELFPQINRG